MITSNSAHYKPSPHNQYQDSYTKDTDLSKLKPVGNINMSDNKVDDKGKAIDFWDINKNPLEIGGFVGNMEEGLNNLDNFIPGFSSNSQPIQSMEMKKDDGYCQPMMTSNIVVPKGMDY